MRNLQHKEHPMIRLGLAVVAALLITAAGGAALFAAELKDETLATRQIEQVPPAHDFL
jgi:hypothetical protein